MSANKMHALLRWSNDLSVGARLVFLVCFALFIMVIIALTGMINNSRMARDVDYGYNAVTRPLAAVASARGQFNAMRTALYDLAQDFNSGVQSRAFKKQVLKNLDEYEESITLYKNILDGYGTPYSYEKEAVGYLHSQLSPLRLYVQSITSIAERTGHAADAVRMLRGNFLDVAEDMSTELEALTRILEEQTRLANASAKRLKDYNDVLSVVMMAAGALFLLVIAYVIVKSITRPMREMTAVTRSLSDGEMDVHVAYRSKNDIGVLADGFRHLAQSVTSIAGEIDGLVKTAAQGRLDARADASRYKGDWASLMTGLNDLLSAIIEPINEAAKVSREISRGNFEARMTGDYKGAIALIKDSVNTTAVSMAAYLNDKLDAERSAHEADLAKGRAEAAREALESGIYYASKIQKNLRPADEAFSLAFADHSIIWEPKDIVGGDIYWMKAFSGGVVLCVCDCTGHGTPGALLTMLAVSALEATVTEDNYQDTAEIMWQLDRKLADVLNVNASGRAGDDILNFDDGCDLALLFVAGHGSVRISSSNIHVFVCNGKEVTRIKGQRLRIGEGKLAGKEAVQSIELPAHPDNAFYVSSDGLYDQIGGAQARPFGYRTFKKLILENHEEKQAVISQKIWSAFEEYRGEQARRDDVQLLTFKPHNRL